MMRMVVMIVAIVAVVKIVMVGIKVNNDDDESDSNGK